MSDRVHHATTRIVTPSRQLLDNTEGDSKQQQQQQQQLVSLLNSAKTTTITTATPANTLKSTSSAVRPDSAEVLYLQSLFDDITVHGAV
jgi:hypothetical protein